MRFHALALAASLALGTLTAACVGSADSDDADNVGDPAVSLDTKLSPRDTTAPAPAPTSTNVVVADPVGCGKMRSACTNEQKVRGLL